MAETPTVAAAVEATAAAVVSTLVPAIAPEVTLIMAIIKAHQNATGGQFPTPQQVQDAMPADTQTLQTMWAAWSQKKGIPA